MCVCVCVCVCGCVVGKVCMCVCVHVYEGEEKVHIVDAMSFSVQLMEQFYFLVSTFLRSLPPGACILKLSLDSSTLSYHKKCMAIMVSSVLIVIGTFIFGDSFVHAILDDAGIL